ncbi:MAG: glutathione S-transferase family protein [Bdellovibrionaceae bacterium]|jgi:glutathione S-transferase|nr:glutathione S-transferase family protein [Pseudobdellovibrionaceae bacterium]
MIELIVYPKSNNSKLINNSPFCSKTEVFLRLANINYEVKNFEGNPSKFSKAKLPVVKFNNELVEDSGFIQKFLEKEFKVSLDSHLSNKEKAQGFAYTKMLEQYLYWSVLHERWFIEENWGKLRDEYFNKIPKLMRGFVTQMIRKKLKAATVGHGMGRHSDVEIFELGYESIDALSNILGENDYLLGNQVSSYDSTAYAFVASMIHSELGPKINNKVMEYPNLIEYDKRMFSLMNF